MIIFSYRTGIKKTLSITLLCASCCIPSFYCTAKESQTKSFGKDILLIINYHFPYYQSMDLLKKIYSPYFPHIVFYGPQAHPGVNQVDHHEGWFSYKVIAMAMQKYQRYTGYFLINDDLIINPPNFARFDKNKVWFPAFRQPELAPDAYTDWAWWPMDVGYTAIKKVYEQMDSQTATIIRQNLGVNKVADGFSDIAYIPAHCAQKFIAVCSLCVQNNVFLEIALPTICASITPLEQIQYINGLALWGPADRSLASQYFNTSLDFIHPIKLSFIPNRKFVARYFKQYWKVS